ncbi:MAG: polysaccharide lyase family 8 super-sandwich domain-containing protein, partial [Pirellulaceae bacterium]
MLEHRRLLSADPIVDFDFEIDQSLDELRAGGWQVDAEILDDQDGIDDLRAIGGALELTDDLGGTTGLRAAHEATYGFAPLENGLLQVAAGTGGSYPGNPSHRINLLASGSAVATIELRNDTQGSLQYGGGSVALEDASWSNQFRNFAITWTVAADGTGGLLSMSFEASDGSLTQVHNRPFLADGVPDGIEIKAGWSTPSNVMLRLDSLVVTPQSPTVAVEIAASQYHDVALGSSAGDAVSGNVHLVQGLITGSPTFSIVGGSGSDLFEIETLTDQGLNRIGRIVVAPDVTLSTEESYTLDLQVANGDQLSSIQTITIHVVPQTAASRVFDALLNQNRFRAADIDDATVADWMSKIQPDGSFSDLSGNHWTQSADRLGSLAEAYAFNAVYQGDGALREKLYDAVLYWVDHVTGDGGSFVNPAWAWPRQIGIVGYFLRSDLRTELRSPSPSVASRAAEVFDAIVRGTESAVTHLRTSDEHFWGGNLGYRLHAMQLRAVLLDDYNRPLTSVSGFLRGFESTASFADIQSLMEKSFDRSVGPTSVGRTQDGAFSQHTGGGAQLFNFGYGRDWAADVITADTMFAETPWSLSQQEYDQLADYILDGVLWQVFKGQGDYAAMGRRAGHTTTQAYASANTLFYRLLRDLESNAGQAQLARYDEVVAARDALNNGDWDLVGQRAFWNHDFALARTADYYVSTKMNSVRSSGNETGNNENLQHYHMGDGMTLVMLTGDEYVNARVGWDWHQLPGTTTESRTDTLPTRRWNVDNTGLNEFAGVLSDGHRSVAAFINDRYDANNSVYQYHTVNSNKGTFFLDDAVVALGSAIQRVGAGQGQPIRTTLNQTELRTDVVYDTGDGIQTLAADDFTQQTFSVLSSPAWFHQDGVGYIILPEQGKAATVRLETRATNNDWYDLRHANGHQNQQVDIFQLSIDHGTDPSDGNYQYVIVPNRTAAEMPALVAGLALEVIENSPSIQAIRDPNADVTQVVFYEAGSVTIEPGMTIASDRPAIVMLSDAAGELEITLSDPLHSTTNNQTALTLNRPLAGPGATWNPLVGETTIVFNQSNDITLAGAPQTERFTPISSKLTLDIAASSISEGSGGTTATVTRNSVATDPLTVTLTSSDANEATTPMTVVIPAGRLTSDPFTIQPVDDANVDGSRTILITADAQGHLGASHHLDVMDDDEPSRWVYQGIQAKLIYRPDAQGDRIPDFADVGYKAGREAIPDVPVVVTVAPGAGDDTARIQAAIDQVAALEPNANGFRGAVLLQRGDYDIETQVVISTSGIVLRGEGRGESDTVLHARGDDRRAIIQIDGSGSIQMLGTPTSIADFVVPSGARSFRVADAGGLQVGDSIRIIRHGNAQWIADLGMDQLDNPWQPESKNVAFERTITHLDGNTITVDVPLVDSFEQRYGGGTVQKFRFDGRIENVGVEDLRGESDFDFDTDEDHAWDFISINRTRDAWVRRTTAQYFAFAHVNIQRDAQRVTVADAINLDPKSEITGARRYAFNVVGQQNLVTGAESHEGRHDYVFAAQVAGPNVFHNSVAINAHADSGPHHRWATGGLFDNIVSDNELDAENRLNSGTGHGWAGANMVFYNSTADGFNVHNPPTSQNWVLGSIGAQRAGNFNQSAPQGNYDSHGMRLTPASLYETQLAERMAHANLIYRELWLGDIDNFTGNDDPAVDNVYVDPDWFASMPSTTTGFDAVGTDRWIPFSFNLGIVPVDTIVGATLALGLRSDGGNPADDLFYIENDDQPRSFGSLGWSVTDAADGFVLDLGNDLELLEDGLLNLAIFGDTAVDWAMLEFQVVPGETITYVDDSFVGDLNDPIVDADLGTQGDQPAVLGVNAFKTIGEAIAATSANGTIVVNGGQYPEDVSLLASQQLRIAGPDATQTVLVDSINGPGGTGLTLFGSLTFDHEGNSSVGRLDVRNNRPTVDTLTIPSNHTLTVVGGMSVGVSGTSGAVTHWTATGGGELIIDDPSATVEIGLANSGNSDPENVTVVDLSGLGAFTADVATFRVGFGSRNQSTLELSNAANAITAETFTIADSNAANSRPARVFLGGGTNTIHADNIHIGLSKGVGTLALATSQSSGTGTITIRGRAGGDSTSDIVVGLNVDTDTGVTANGTLDLRGLAANVIAGNLTIAHRTRTGVGGVVGSVSIDDGSFAVDSITMATRSAGDGNALATLNVHGGDFTVNAGGGFKLAEHSGGGVARGEIYLTGGMLTSHVDIVDAGGITETK